MRFCAATTAVALALGLSGAFAQGGGGGGGGAPATPEDDATEEEVETVGTVLLTQDDFDSGTYRIVAPGTYRLSEDISFSPNEDSGDDAYDSFFATDDQLGDDYPEPEFTLGFFSAITVESNDVEIDLNGFTLEQSEGHALMQRFFSLIELANAPFLPTEGPHTFTDELDPAENVYIHDGTLGRSSHHGIHGNNNVNVTISGVDFTDFEIAAVHLNGVDGLTVEDSEMENRKDVPVVGTFSAARFLQRYVDYLVDEDSETTLDVLGETYDALAIQDDLRNAINNVYDDVVADGEIDSSVHSTEHGLFDNSLRIPDGNAYCVVTNPSGVAIFGYPSVPDDADASTDVVLSNIRCVDHNIQTREVVVLSQNDNAVTDVVGATVQLLNTNSDGDYITINQATDIDDAYYSGNAVANAQIFVGKAALNGEFDDSDHDASKSGVTQDMVDWVESGELGVLGDLATDGWFCNGDAMFHVMKGTTSFRIDGTIGAELDNVELDGSTNFGAAGSDECGDYTFSHPLATYEGYNGNNARAFSFAGSEDITVTDCSASDVSSSSGDAYAFDVHTDSSAVDLSGITIDTVEADEGVAYGVHFGEDTSDCSVSDLTTTGVDTDVLDEGSDNSS